MADLFSTIQMLIICATVFGIVFMVMLAMPQSKMRSYLLEAMKYLLAMGMLVLVISPIDLLPDILPGLGFGDDLGYIAAAIASISSARKERQERKYLP